jgi:hypothetical protein
LAKIEEPHANKYGEPFRVVAGIVQVKELTIDVKLPSQ